VAAELESSAGRAQARGGLAAAAAFLERAALLTPDPARRAGRTLAAAQTSLRAGAFGQALELLAMAEAEPLDELQGARADWLRGQIAFASGPGSDASLLLLKAARRLEPLDPGLAPETYLDAWQAALFAGHLAGGGDLEEVSRAARALPRPEHPPQVADLLLDGLALLVTDGPAAAAPVLRQAIGTFAGPDVPVAERLRWSWWAPVASLPLWDSEGYRLIVPPAIGRTYTEDVTFIDPDGEFVGWQALSDQAQKHLDGLLAGYVFEEDGPTYAGTDTAALAWRFGPPGKPIARGIDILTIRDGRVSAVRTLIAPESDA